jgi:hypothetical protein
VDVGGSVMSADSVGFVLENTVDESTGISGTGDYNITLPPLFKSEFSLGIDGFTRLFTLVAESVYKQDTGRDIKVLPAYPDEIVNYAARSGNNPVSNFQECITYQIIRREPGAIAGDATGPFEGRKEIKPRLRETVYDTSSGNYVEVHGQRFDNLVLFDCWTKSNDEADMMRRWLENFMVVYTGFFKRCGVQEMLYFRSGRFTWGTNEEEAMSMWRNPLKVRSVVWFVRTEDLFTVVRGKIEKVQVTISVVNP